MQLCRKRTSSSLEEGASDHENQPESCPVAKQKASGCSAAQDCQRWLHSHGLLEVAQHQQQPAPLGPQFWWALAELNVTLSAFQHEFQEQTLLDSVCFTKSSKAEAFEKLAFARGCTDEASLQAQPALLAARALLHTALGGCSEAAISQVTLRCPPFLAGWLHRWAPGAACGRLRLLVLQGYRPAGAAPLRACTVYNLGMPTIVSAPAQCTVFVPCL